MGFKVGEKIVKPSLGLCEITAIKKMVIDGKQQDFYVVEAGVVQVMVPVKKANSGGLRAMVTEKEADRLLNFFADPLELDDPEEKRIEELPFTLPEADKMIKHRQTKEVSRLAKLLFYINKNRLLDKHEEELLTSSIGVIAEEIATLRHTTKAKYSIEIRSSLAKSYKAFKENLDAD